MGYNEFVRYIGGMAMIYTLTCNPAWDYAVYTEDMTLGETNRSCRETLRFGGKGINVSAVLTALGVENTALGFVAGFMGEALEAAVRAAGIRTDFIHLPTGQTRINVKLKDAQETEINAQGPAIPADCVERLFSQLDVLGEDDVLVLAGSVPRSLPTDFYQQIMARLCPRGVRFAVDATGELLLDTLRYRPLVIKPNRRELEELVGASLTDDEAIRAAATDLQARGAQYVLVSLGGDGAMLFDTEGQLHRVAAHAITVVDTVGAGDSMLAGFLAGLPQGAAYALALGNAAGAATAASDTLATAVQIQNRMK